MLKCGKQLNERFDPLMLIRSRKLSPRGVSAPRETRAWGGQHQTDEITFRGNHYREVPSDLSKEERAGALSSTRLEIYRVRNYHEAGVSATFGIAYIALGEHVTGHIEFE